MRIARLDLIRYGGFAGKTLDFGQPACDLHILHGPNEAGKSTLMQAVSDLLFGFPHHKGQDWQFDADMLRVGARLAQGDETLDMIRRRGRVRTLRNGDDTTECDENLLLRWLGGVDRERFERMWSLDHQRLRHGGETMAALEGDLGEQLLAAGFGLDTVRSVRDSLDRQASALWKKGTGRNATRLHELGRRYRTARDTLSRAASDTQDWVALTREARTLEKTLTTLDQALRDEEASLTRLQRSGRILPDLRRLETLEAEHAADTPALFSVEETSRFHALLKEWADLRAERDDAVRKREGLLPLRAACKPDTAILAHKTTIGDFRAAFAARAAREQALSEDRAAMRALESDLKAQGLEGTPEAIRDALPDLALIGIMRPLCDETERLARRRTEWQAARSLAQHALDETMLRLDALPTYPVDALRIALRQAERGEDPDRALERLDRSLAGNRAECAQAMRDLAPWQGSVAALDAMAIPDETRLTQARDLWRSRIEAERNALEALREQDRVRETLELELRQLEREEIVSAATLETVRRERNALFSALIAQPTRPGPDDIAAYESARARSDALADRRFAAAEKTARLAALEQALERNALDRRQSGSALASSREARQNEAALWSRELAASGLPDLDPEHLPGWLARRARACAAFSAQATLTAERASIQCHRDRHLEALRQLVPPFPAFPGPALTGRDGSPGPEEAGVPPGSASDATACPEDPTDRQERAGRAWSSLGDAIAHASTVLEGWEQNETRIRTRQQDAEQHRKRLDALDREEEALSRAEDRLDAAWSDVLRLRPDLSRCDSATLALMETRRRDTETLLRHRERLAREDEALRDLEDSFRAFLTRLAPQDALSDRALADRMAECVLALETATIDADHAAKLDRGIAEANAEIGTHQRSLAACEAQLADWFSRSGTQDMESLRAVFARSSVCHARLEEMDRLRSAICRSGDGLALETLRQAASETDPDILPALIAEHETRRDAKRQEREKAVRRQGEIDEQRRHIEGEDLARDAALEMETCRAEMAIEAERWASARIQSLLLHRVATRQRPEHTNPLLQGASHLFGRLTLGRYQGLTVLDSGTPELVGIRAGEQGFVRPGQMSEGTRDQLFLALRLSAVEQAQARGIVLPFLADDLFITFDEARARAGMDILTDLSRTTQILFLTHHAHLAEPESLSVRSGATRHTV